MYTVKVEARMDILGNVVERLTFKDVNANNRQEAKKIAENEAHKLYCQKYGMPVHFIAVSAKLG